MMQILNNAAIAYASVFALYDIVNMDDIFGWHGNFIKSCSICNDPHLVIYVI